MTETFLFIDTNFLIEYKPIQDIDWTEVLNCQKVRLLVAPTVTDELDKHKLSKGRKRNRAVKAIKMLDELPESLEPVEIRNNVTLQFLPVRYADHEKYKLSQQGDDQLLLSAIHFKDQNQTGKVCILSGDKNFRLRMSTFDIQPIRPNDDWLLPSESDELEKQIKKLESELKKLPKLVLDTVDGGNRLKYTLPYPPNAFGQLESQIEQKVADNSPLHAIAYSPFIDKNDREHNRRLICDYIKYDYMPFAEKWIDYHTVMARVCLIKLKLQNNGGCPANNIRININFKGDSDLKILEDILSEPHVPPPPKLLFKDGTEDCSADFIEQNTKQKNIQSKFILDITDREASIIIPSLQHFNSLKLPIIGIQFDDRRRAKSFSLSAKLVCDELSKESEYRFDVHVSKDMSNTKHFELPMPFREA